MVHTIDPNPCVRIGTTRSSDPNGGKTSPRALTARRWAQQSQEHAAHHQRMPARNATESPCAERFPARAQPEQPQHLTPKSAVSFEGREIAPEPERRRAVQ